MIGERRSRRKATSAYIAGKNHLAVIPLIHQEQVDSQYGDASMISRLKMVGRENGRHS